MEEGETCVFADAFSGLGVYEIPGEAHVAVGHVVEAVEEPGEVVEADVAVTVSVCGVDLFVFGLVAGRHVPVEAVAQAGGVVVVFDGFELGLRAGEGAIGLDEMRFGFGDEPVGEDFWDVY